MIDKRMMYAMGQRVAKTLDGSRPGYRGSDYGGGGSGPAGGASAGGNYGGNSSGGTSANDMSNNTNEGPAGSRPGNNNTVDPGFQNALRNQQIRQNTITQSQNPNFGQFLGSRVPTYQAPTLGQRIGSGVSTVGDMFGNYIKSGGMLGMAGRGLGSLLEGIFGPSIPSTGNVGPAGIKTDGTYGTIGDAINAGRRNEGPINYDNDDEGNQGIMAAYNPNILPVEEEVSEEEKDFIQRFRVANEFRQDKQGQLDPAILEMISKLYT